MEAALLDFVFDVAAAFLALVAQDFGKDVLEGVVANGSCDGMIAVVADVEGGAKEVARAFGGIGVVALQLGDVVDGAQHAGDNQLVERYALIIQAVVECLSDVLQQDGSTRHQIGYGVGEAVDMIVRTLADIHQFLHAMFGILTILHGTNAPLFGSHNLYALAVGECRLIVSHRTDAVGLVGIVCVQGGFVGGSCLHQLADACQQGDYRKEACDELTLGGLLISDFRLHYLIFEI